MQKCTKINVPKNPDPLKSIFLVN